MGVSGSSVGRATRQRTVPLASVAVIAGGAMIVVGSFLPWTTGWTAPLFEFGWEGGDGGWWPGWSGIRIVAAGLVVLLAGLVVIAAGIATFHRRRAWMVSSVICLVAAALTWMAYQRALDRFGSFSHPYGAGYEEHVGEMGIGMWLLLGGALLGGIASLWLGVRAVRSLRSVDQPKQGPDPTLH